jgi:hypothetical protein
VLISDSSCSCGGRSRRPVEIYHYEWFFHVSWASLEVLKSGETPRISRTLFVLLLKWTCIDTRISKAANVQDSDGCS